MDSQGFIAENFTVPTSAASAERIAANAIAKARGNSVRLPAHGTGHHAPVKSAGSVKGAAGDAAGLARVQLSSHSQRRGEHLFEGARNLINTVGMIDLAALSSGWIFRKIGLKKAGSILGGWKGIHEEASLFKLPAAMARRVSELAGETGQHALKSSATAKSAELAQKAVTWEASFANFVKPVTDVVKKVTQGETMQRVAAKTPQFVKSAGAAFGRMSLIGKLFTASAALGLVASGFRTVATKKESNAMLEMLATDLGGNTQGQFYQAIHKVRSGESKELALKFGADAASATADAVMWGSASGMSVKAMTAMAGSQMLTTLITANPLLGGYQALKMHAAGKVELNAEQRVEAVLSLMQHLPSIKQHGGKYNHLARGMAQEMVTRDMKPEAVVQLLNDKPAFEALMVEVKAKQDAAKATKTEQPKAGAVTAKPAAVAAQGTVDIAPKAANAPSYQVGAVHHEGKVSAPQAIKRQ